MNTAFTKLGMGIVFAIALVYFLMVVNFQSWLDPLIIIMGLPGAFSGILWMLFATQTTFNVPSLMGTIMCIGVATSNSILLITFANDQRLEDGAESLTTPRSSAGTTRLRPGVDDGAGDDPRHDPDEPRPRRGRRTERAAGPRGHRRAVAGDGDDAVFRAGDVQHPPQQGRWCRSARKTPNCLFEKDEPEYQLAKANEDGDGKERAGASETPARERRRRG